MKKKKPSYIDRTAYRTSVSGDIDTLFSYNVSVEESDLFVRSDSNLEAEAYKLLHRLRNTLKHYIAMHPAFATTLSPWENDPVAPDIIREMIDASQAAEVGPMAAVAGAVADFIGTGLEEFSESIIVENGGDIFARSVQDLYIPIFSGTSPLNMKVRIKVAADKTPCGICTSSGTIGHSLSFGAADAVSVLSEKASLADAAATAICNRVRTQRDIEAAIAYGAGITGITGILVIAGDKLGAWGDVEIA